MKMPRMLFHVMLSSARSPCEDSCGVKLSILGNVRSMQLFSQGTSIEHYEFVPYVQVESTVSTYKGEV